MAKERGARLVQCNVDMMLGQFFESTSADLIAGMMNKDRQKLFAASRTCAATVVGAAPLLNVADPAHNIGGTITLALYNILCENRFSGGDEQDRQTLGKDRMQPLLKVGVDDLARIALTDAQRTAFLTAMKAIVDPDPDKVLALKTLSQACSMTNSTNLKLVESVQIDLQKYYLLKRERYTTDQPDKEGKAPKVGLFPAVNPHMDTIKSDKWVTRIGEGVSWRNKNDISACKSGKPIFPRKVDTHGVMVVAEVRQSEHPFNQKYWGSL